MIRLFISHSATDAAVAAALIDLLRAALNLPAEAIRCTSIDGYRLPGGARTDDHLRREVHEAEAFIGIVSINSIRSLYVLFELGARWGAGRHLVPVLAPGIGVDVLQGPLRGINALRADSTAQLHQLVSEIGAELGLSPAQPASYYAQLERVVQLPRGETIAVEAVPGLAHGLTFDERSVIGGLSPEARELLLAAAGDPDGLVLAVEDSGGLAIGVGAREFVQDHSARNQAKWKRALSELQSFDLIESQNPNGTVLAVTDDGFRIADRLSSTA